MNHNDMAIIAEQMARVIERTIRDKVKEERGYQTAVLGEAVRGYTTLDFELHPGAYTKVAQIAAITKDIEVALGSEWGVRVTQRGGRVVVECNLPPALRRTVRLTDIDPRERKGLTAVFGVDRTGTPIAVNLAADSHSNVLVAGSSGSGKSNLVQCVLACLARTNTPATMQVYAVSRKREDTETLPSLLGPMLVRAEAEGQMQVQDVIQRVTAELGNRMRMGKADIAALPHLVFYVEEMGSLIQQQGEPARVLLTNIAATGRSNKIHLIAVTQKPTASIVGDQIRTNMGVLVCFRVVSPEDARVALGMSGTGANLLPEHDAIIVAGSHKPMTVRAPFLDGAYRHRLSNHLLDMVDTMEGSPGPSSPPTVSRSTPSSGTVAPLRYPYDGPGRQGRQNPLECPDIIKEHLLLYWDQHKIDGEVRDRPFINELAKQMYPSLNRLGAALGGAESERMREAIRIAAKDLGVEWRARSDKHDDAAPVVAG